MSKLPAKRTSSGKLPALPERRSSFREWLEDWRERAEVAAFILWTITHPRQWREMQDEWERKRQARRLAKLRSVPEVTNEIPQALPPPDSKDTQQL